MSLEEETKQALTSALSSLSNTQSQDLVNIAFNNLKALLSDPNGALAKDPELAKDVYVCLAKTNQAEIETRRRLVDTYIRYHQVTADRTQVPPPSNNILPDDSSVENSTFGDH